MSTADSVPPAQPDSPATEDSPAAEVREHHTQALAEIARNHHRALVHYLAARVGVQEAADVAQEAYARLLALDRPGTVSFLTGYLWKIAGNLVLDRRRHAATVKRLDPVALFQPEEFASPPEATLYSRQRVEQVEQALAELPPRCLQAFTLRVLEERPYAEVARIMDVAERVARKYVSRALEHVHHRLAEGDPDRRTPT